MSQNLANALQSLWEGTEKNSKIADHRNNSFAVSDTPFAPTPFDDLVILGFGASSSLLSRRCLIVLVPPMQLLFMQIQRPNGG